MGMQKLRSSLVGLLAVSIMISACGNADKTEDKTASADTIAAIKDTMVAAPAPMQPTPFSQVVRYEEKLSFSVSSPQLAEKNTLLIVPIGFTASNDSILMNIEGTVLKVESVDINGDNSPELLVVTQDASKKGYAYVFSGNKNKSVSQVNIQDAGTTKGALDGYQGEDDYALVESVLARRFPIYKGGSKTGKTRQIQYKLRNGEAMKQLVVDKVLTF
jgi:hypothetical protein